MRLSRISEYKRIESSGTRGTGGSNRSKPSKGSKGAKPSEPSKPSRRTKPSKPSPTPSPFRDFGTFTSRGPPPARFLVSGSDLTTSAHVFVEDKPDLDEVTALARLVSGRRSSHPLAVRLLLAFARTRPKEFVAFVRGAG
ncbi:MAG TPA: hypothetical protein VI997_08510 [Candidatus Thermoplasmatota archaeon]|nr:hypothetical protein [Candidatus Thermoplasmatota archaeon]